MPADFPSSPTLNQTYTFGGRTWTWNGTGWQLVANATDTLTLTDGLVVPLASASSPSVRFSGDTNTGLYSPGADQVAISTGGTGRLFVSSNGTITTAQSVAVTGGLATWNAGLNLFSPSAGVGQIAASTDASGTAGTLIFQTGTERARIDSSGRLLVGTSSSADVGGASAVAQFTSTASAPHTLSLVRNNTAILALANSGSVSSGSGLGAILFCGNDGTDLNTLGALILAEVDGTPGANDMPGRLVFSTTADGASSPTERMRISNTGQVSINTTDALNTTYFDGALRVKNNASCITSRQTGAAGASTFIGWHEAASGDNAFCIFGTEASIAIRGSISYNRGGGVVAYNTTSDYRSKTILGAIEDSGPVIDAFKVYRGVMNGASVARPMMIAHEAQEVAPYCVTGEKDAVDANGNPIYQQMDHQVLVPLLIAEIQQLRSRVAALEAQ